MAQFSYEVRARETMSTWRFNLLWLLIGLATAITRSSADGNGSTIIQNDLTTDIAKQIMRRAKAAEIRTMLDTHTLPCDDFYSYACGNWKRHNPADILSNSMTDNFQLISKGFDRRLQQVLRHEAKTGVETKLQRFHQSCQLVHRDDVHYKLALENVYKEFGELPALAGENWNKSDFSWWRTVAQIQHKYGKQIIFAVDIMRDFKTGSENRIYLGTQKYENLKEGTIAKDLQQFFGVSKEVAKATAKDILELDDKLKAGSSNTRDAALQDLLSLQKVSQLQEQYGSNINLTEFLSLVLGGYVPEQIYTYDGIYLEATFRTTSSTAPHTLANYILWRLLQEFLADVDSKDIDKWCIEKTKNYFGKYVDYLVYARYRNDAVEAEVFSMWEEIRATFRQELAGDKLDWIANETRTTAIEKLERMELAINSYTNVNFEELYGNVTIDGLNYVANVQRLLAAQAERKLRSLNNQPTTLEPTKELSFAASYSLLENKIQIPVALLQPHYLWGPNYPEALKYATLGSLIAHEMIHGFDDDGQKHDASGNFSPWWDRKSRYEFEARRKCFQAQYHSYQYGETKLPDSKLQSENIADNASVKLAYAAYQRWLQKQPPTNPIIEIRETLPGLEINNRQLFFVGFAQLWCDDVQTQFRSKVALDSHAPSKFRVVGSLSNFQEFSWVFNCPQDAPMDPKYKCAIY
ncbi:neprilysin-1 [Scaptodrosophila lebanonensis]|uniref:Neprilysin-1 n=1 Tax=Drosophila lebanonensis TaxID=7225 RepID=A0A6J2T7M0_DROLE|nr:neprilysin-1 [Scaptodrosophila lebanonensis]